MMRSLIFLTLLAFVAGTLVLVTAAKESKGIIFSFSTKKGERISITEEEFDAYKHECPHEEPEKCYYKNNTACFCRPKFFGYNREERHFYSPLNNECFKFTHIDNGCNSFNSRRECLKSCKRGTRPGPQMPLKNRNKNRV
uniref:Putative secreted protein n=1 Tax=Amblyomma cajennense TaxID=34607 RepID=A0A023FF10_AMBCJ